MMREHFRTARRDDGRAYVTTTDTAPEWVMDMVRDAHDEEFPDDWRYAEIRDIAEWIDECLDNGMSVDDMRDDLGSYVDGAVNIYTSDLLAWVSGNITRLSYCDQYVEEFGEPGDGTMANRLQCGQAWCIEQMASVMLDYVPSGEDES